MPKEVDPGIHDLHNSPTLLESCRSILELTLPISGGFAQL
jgi:hypothetical protein